jgi:hypothetical protein
MTSARIGRWRLHAQHLSRQVFDDPADLVRWIGAVQAQDYLAALWGVGLRTRGSTERGVEQALADRTIVRTHFMRNTVHLVPAADLRWMMRLVAPRIRMIIDNIGRAARLGLDESVYARSNAVIAAELAGGRRLTRAALAAALERAGISTDGRLTLITQRAQTDGLICHALRQGASYELALVDEWLPPSPVLARDEALAEFTRRYFRSHGPATVRDYAWWSGLTLTDARAGLDLVQPELQRETVDGVEYWFAEPEPAAPTGDPCSAHLLANYDEYTVGYKNRDAIFDPTYRAQVRPPQHNILFVHTIALDGEILGTWQRTRAKGAVVVELATFRKLRPGQVEAVLAAAVRYGRFTGQPVRIELSGAQRA